MHATEKKFMLCVLGALVSATAAAADCTTEPFERWISVEEAAARATELGYQVREIEIDDGCYEIEARDADGQKVEIILHPLSGEAVRIKPD